MSHIVGRWTDANGDKKIISFYSEWSKHQFSLEEQNRLLNGEEITFQYTDRNGNRSTVTGHIQYRYNRNNDTWGYGFVGRGFPGFEQNPVIPQNNRSTYSVDKKLEEIVHEFLRPRYYERKINEGVIHVFHKYEDRQSQERGKDVSFFKNDEEYIVDEKAQVRYIYDPRDSFVLEIISGRERNDGIGWYVNDDLETRYYLFLWPFTQETIISPDTIERVDYALVNKDVIVNHIAEKTGFDSRRLLTYARNIVRARGETDDAIPVTIGTGYRYIPEGFGDDLYFRYSTGINERPVNLVASKRMLEVLSEEHDTIYR